MDARTPLPDMLRAARRATGMSQAEVAMALCALTGTAALTRHDVSRWERGRRRPTAWLEALAITLDLDPRQLAAAPQSADDPDADPAAAELLERLAASDVSAATLDAITARVMDARRAYPVQPPPLLYEQVGRDLRRITPLLEARATLAQRRELLVAAGWLALLRACLAVDLDRRAAADTATATGRALGQHADHGDLIAWTHEIAAWRALLADDYPAVHAHAAAGLAHTGPATSVRAQLHAQRARAAARTGDGPATRRALDDVVATAARLPASVGPAAADHFTFDAAKVESYRATTLAWIGDGSPEAEQAARHVITTYAGQRRLATAHLDLGLILAARGELTEADHQGVLAVTTRLLVPSSLARARELAAVVAPAHGDLPDAVRALDA
ncbi:helix-turn-helix domain-containing protein [Actinomadura kijaniata]|uniref:helix-turn-helix domain-containing protein n=1 Tax=Actinomadura kijaniata TaxID=46161 RepID=UPI00082C81C6|nr:helix-turn-helix transcriptional regulator [Actinomadura kijaniata]